MRCEICYIWICRTCRAGEGAKSVKGDKTTTGRWKNRGTVYDASMREMVPVSRSSRLPESRLERKAEGGGGRALRVLRVPLPAVLRLHLHILALLACRVILLVLAHGHVRLAEDLQGNGAQLCGVAPNRRVFEDAVAGVAKDGLDLELRTLFRPMMVS